MLVLSVSDMLLLLLVSWPKLKVWSYPVTIVYGSVYLHEVSE